MEQIVPVVVLVAFLGAAAFLIFRRQKNKPNITGTGSGGDDPRPPSDKF